MKRQTGAWALAVVIAIITVLFTVRLRGIDPDARATVICHESECLVLVYERYFGWNRNLLRHLLGFLRSMLAASDPPTDKTTRERVIRITPTGVQQLSFRGSWYIFEVYANNIYARGGERVQVWTGTDFRPLTPIELESLNAARGREAVLYGDFTDRQGWTSRVLNPGQQLAYTLSQEPATISMQEDPAGRQQIELQRGNTAPTTIWTLDAQRGVSKKQYDELFTPR